MSWESNTSSNMRSVVPHLYFEDSDTTWVKACENTSTYLYKSLIAKTLIYSGERPYYNASTWTQGSFNDTKIGTYLEGQSDIVFLRQNIIWLHRNVLDLITLVKNNTNTKLGVFESRIERQERVTESQIPDLANRVDEVSGLFPRIVNLESRVMESDQQQQESLANVRSELTIQTRVNDQRAKIVEDLQVELQASRQENADLQKKIKKQKRVAKGQEKDLKALRDRLDHMDMALRQRDDDNRATLLAFAEIASQLRQIKLPLNISNRANASWERETPTSSAACSEVDEPDI